MGFEPRDGGPGSSAIGTSEMGPLTRKSFGFGVQGLGLGTRGYGPGFARVRVANLGYLY